jgi:hypothetical protein
MKTSTWTNIVTHRFRVVYNQGLLGSGQHPWWLIGEDSMGKPTHGTVGKRHRSLKNKMEGEGRKRKGMGTCGTPWNLMESHGRKWKEEEQGVWEPWNLMEGAGTSAQP